MVFVMNPNGVAEEIEVEVEDVTESEAPDHSAAEEAKKAWKAAGKHKNWMEEPEDKPAINPRNSSRSCRRTEAKGRGQGPAL
jgi:hypothetical protein